MQEQLVSRLEIQNELDVMLAHKRAKQITEVTGFNFAEQTKFATSVSEISRNVIEHAESGIIKFTVSAVGKKLLLNAIVQDKGAGIEDLNGAVNNVPDRRGKGVGLLSAKRLVDHFEIETEIGKGTCVRLSMTFPYKHPPINEVIIKGWKEFFENETVLSPYELLKKQNFQLLDALEEIKHKNNVVENQLDEIRRLNNNLESNFTEIRRLSEETVERNELLEKKNEELDDFAYIVTHDLKAPLNNMVGLIDYLSEDLPDKKDDFDLLKGQAERMVNIINRILSYSRSGRQDIETKEVNVEQLIKQISQDLTASKNIKIHLDENLPVITTEEIYLHQVFSNLISNAVKYNDTPNGNIWIHMSTEYPCCNFIIADDGPGIPVDKRDKIFDMYATIKAAKSVESTGIGLAIVKKIVESKGGTIKIEDRPGGGAQFVFSWPIKQAAEV